LGVSRLPLGGWNPPENAQYGFAENSWKKQE